MQEADCERGKGITLGGIQRQSKRALWRESKTTRIIEKTGKIMGQRGE